MRGVVDLPVRIVGGHARGQQRGQFAEGDAVVGMAIQQYRHADRMRHRQRRQQQQERPREQRQAAQACGHRRTTDGSNM